MLLTDDDFWVWSGLFFYNDVTGATGFEALYAVNRQGQSYGIIPRASNPPDKWQPTDFANVQRAASRRAQPGHLRRETRGSLPTALNMSAAEVDALLAELPQGVSS